MPEWIPVPGSAKARLIEAAMHHFEQAGFEAATVTELASKAGVTTGSLYHHFGSKLGLYTVVRDDLEKRITDRMEGAAETVGGAGRDAARAALLVAFDATVRFGVCRLLGETAPGDHPDRVRATLTTLLPDDVGVAATLLVAAWRSALLEVADGAPAAGVRTALEFVLA
ncbi:TetR/AcrR family transcriptional regulator [Jiangella anatolica]|uniref:TetR/AcrR family transcriptional regulator n=1 Tax=Jiangella anatolica TaxID=2670374 RepID=A0A2W2BSQ2_9ACTN|nr:TetR/AcrR family transcriptional regulator [Jiangella anatolica]PZF83474.1 TetR/AcrR family transcriptional regulator [Jiangella anatolica]